MDYGQNTNNNPIRHRDFPFTPGIGLASDSINASGPSLDASEFPMADYDSSSLGNAALRHTSSVAAEHLASPTSESVPSFRRRSTSETIMAPPSHESQRPAQAEIISLNTPPLADSPMTPKHPTDPIDSYMEDDPRITRLFADGKISKKDLADIKLEQQKLAQTGDIASFYEYWSEARTAANEHKRRTA